MKAIDLQNHFISLADWIDPFSTVDKIIIGNPDKEIHNIMVTWISSFSTIRTAVENGFDMVITHEPTFWHDNELMVVDKSEIRLHKKRYIDENGLVILRIHDVWDKMPEIGIPWAWARFLDLGDTPDSIGNTGYQHRYDIEPIELNELAKAIAKKTESLGEPYIQVIGDGSCKVSRIGIGTGAACDIDVFQQMGCDVSIVCDDGVLYWSDIQRAADAGHPVIRVNHGTSEEPGMITLTEYINENFRNVKAKFYPHGSCFRLVGANMHY
jgi:putative NIF3 family GTP cyclohydrolase 1 type 2